MKDIKVHRIKLSDARPTPDKATGLNEVPFPDDAIFAPGDHVVVRGWYQDGPMGITNPWYGVEMVIDGYREQILDGQPVAHYYHGICVAKPIHLSPMVDLGGYMHYSEESLYPVCASVDGYEVIYHQPL